jgi:hypothetical protein
MQHRSTNPQNPVPWTPADDLLLRELKDVQRLGWKEIATQCTYLCYLLFLYNC